MNLENVFETTHSKRMNTKREPDSSSHMKTRMLWRCSDPSCNCRKAPPQPEGQSIQLVSRDVGSEDLHQLHIDHAEFDVLFDIVSGTMVVKQKVRDPIVWPPAQHSTAVFFTQTHTTLVNIEGLADNSLLVTFKLSPSNSANTQPKQTAEKKQTGSPTKLKVRCRDHGFIVNNSLFFKTFEDWKGDEKILQLLLPGDRIDSWRTVALILLTFREINTTIWHRLVNDEMGEVAGFDWAALRDKIKTTSPGLDIRPKTNLPMQDESAQKTKTAIEACLIANKTGMGYKGFRGLGSSDNRPFVLRQALSGGDLGFKG